MMSEDKGQLVEKLGEIVDERLEAMKYSKVATDFMNMKKYRCNYCGGTSTSVDINNHTMEKYCKNRQQRRAYVPIEKTKHGDRRWYTCPCCGENISRRNGWKDIN